MSVSKEVAVETDLSIRRLIARYCQLVDDRHFDAVPALFTEDARYRLAGEDLTGREAIRGWLNSIPESLFHLVTNVVVSNGSQPGTYHAVSDLIAGRKGDSGWSIVTLARYHDTFCGEGREMRFSQRIVTFR
jgi:hypothetical protein